MNSGAGVLLLASCAACPGFLGRGWVGVAVGPRDADLNRAGQAATAGHPPQQSLTVAPTMANPCPSAPLGRRG